MCYVGAGNNVGNSTSGRQIKQEPPHILIVFKYILEMFLEILSKLTSESLLSLYPVFVKHIGLPLGLQTWSRCFSYATISAIFIDNKWRTNSAQKDYRLPTNYRL